MPLNDKMAFLRDDSGALISLFRVKDATYPKIFHIGFIRDTVAEVGGPARETQRGGVRARRAARRARPLHLLLPGAGRLHGGSQFLCLTTAPGATPEARAAFIARNTRLLPVPHAPEIRLHVADEATALWQKTEDELGEMGLPPPFWAFAWAGGQALARYILDTPDTVRGLRVLDFAAGSGLVAIAAAMAGARSIEASDIDAYAAAAIALNAATNGVEVAVRAGDLLDRDDGWDVVLAAISVMSATWPQARRRGYGCSPDAARRC